MKILLIDPPFQRFMGFYRFYYPLGLASMAAVLQRAGHSVVILDADHAAETDTLPWSDAAQRSDNYLAALEDDTNSVWKEIRNVISREKPDILGATMLSVKADSAAKITKICREVDQDIVTVVGADHPSTLPDLVLQDESIDVVVRGEGEETFLDLVSRINEKGRKGAFDGTPGTSYRISGQPVHIPARPLIDNLDNLPFPAIESILDWDSYRPVDLGAILTSRGCCFHCTFCGVHNVWTRNVRYRSAENVLKEMVSLKDTFGTNYFSFRDPNFTLNRSRVIAFCDHLIELGLGVEWECLTRVDLLDEELLQRMQRSGCTTIRVGIESGDPDVLHRMRKGFDLDAVRGAARIMNAMGFYWSSYFLFGTPHETAKSMWRTLAFIQEIQPPFVTISRYATIPGTEMFEQLKDAGRISGDVNWGLEGNQQFASNYVLGMTNTEFEGTMSKIASAIEEHNLIQAERFGRCDARLKQFKPG